MVSEVNLEEWVTSIGEDKFLGKGQYRESPEEAPGCFVHGCMLAVIPALQSPAASLREGTGLGPPACLTFGQRI